MLTCDKRLGCCRWSNTLDELRQIGARDQEALYINEGNMPQTVGCFRRYGFGTDLIGIQTQHSQLGEVCHVGCTAETAQGELWKTWGERNMKGGLWVMSSKNQCIHIPKISTAAYSSRDFKYVCARKPELVLIFLWKTLSNNIILINKLSCLITLSILGFCFTV